MNRAWNSENGDSLEIMFTFPFRNFRITYLYNLLMCRPLIFYSMNYSRSNCRYGLKYNGVTSSLGGKDMGIGGLDFKTINEQSVS